MAESTQALWMRDREDQRHASASKGRRVGVFNMYRKNVYLVGVSVTVLMTCALLGMAAYSIRKNHTRQSGHSVQDYGSSKHSADPHDFSQIEIPDPPREAAEISVPTVIDTTNSASFSTRPAIKHRPAGRVTRQSTLLKAQQNDDVDLGPRPCSTDDCHNQSDYLRKTMNFAADPCEDFYDYVCGNYRGHSDGPYAEIEERIRNATISLLSAARVPDFNQNAFQKAAALYQACYALAASSRNELEELKSFMVGLRLDLLTVDTSPRAVNPAYVVARLSLDVGIPVLFEFKLFDGYFVEGKRVMQFKISDSQEAWEKKRALLSTKTSANVLSYISDQLLHYPGYNPESQQNKNLAQAIYRYDEAVITALKTYEQGRGLFISRVIEEMGLDTAPHITPAQWSSAVSLYTKGAYGSQDVIQFQKEALGALAGLLKSSIWGQDGLRISLAWGLFDALLDYTLPQKVVFGKDKDMACYHHVLEVMEYAATSRYLRNVVSWSARRRANDLFLSARDAIKSYLDSNGKLQQAEKLSALRILFFMKAIICSPEQRLDQVFVNKHFDHFPDMAASGRFLDAWLKALSGRAHQKWTDQTNVLFNTSSATPFYLKHNNSVVIPAGALLPVSLYADGSPALSVGSLGDALAHQIMKAYEFGGNEQCYSKGTRARHHKAMDCLRESHAKAGYPVPERGNGKMDLENLADLVAADLGHELYWTLPSDERSWTLPDVNLTGEQLALVGRCVTLCKFNDLTPKGSLAGPRPRCNVPAMNMRVFGKVFICKLSARMNAGRQCTFSF